ncbi:MAG: hypothetical protein GY754_21710, partial [bacterium]|nr:hypothetical protein [bacterium]
MNRKRFLIVITIALISVYLGSSVENKLFSQEKAEKKEALKGDKKNAGKGEGLAEAMKKDKTLKLSVDKVVQYLL